jgi:hypothetical protein
MRVAVELPEAARTRLQELIVARDAALDASRSANARLNALSGDADPQMRTRLAAARDQQNHRHGQLAQLLSRVQQWLAELRSGVVLEEAPPAAIVLPDGQTLDAALAAARAEVKSLRGRLVAVKAAPLPREDQCELAVEHVVRLGQAARPAVGIVGDKLRVGFRGDMAAADDVLALLCWAMPEAVCAALEREIAAQPARADALPASERMRRVAELEAQLLELETREEALLKQAAAAGQDIVRRPDADVRAVLGVVIAKAQAQAAA